MYISSVKNPSVGFKLMHYSLKQTHKKKQSLQPTHICQNPSTLAKERCVLQMIYHTTYKQSLYCQYSSICICIVGQKIPSLLVPVSMSAWWMKGFFPYWFLCLCLLGGLEDSFPSGDYVCVCIVGQNIPSLVVTMSVSVWWVRIFPHQW